jgi:hypothetical protein
MLLPHTSAHSQQKVRQQSEGEGQLTASCAAHGASLGLKKLATGAAEH